MRRSPRRRRARPRTAARVDWCIGRSLGAARARAARASRGRARLATAGPHAPPPQARARAGSPSETRADGLPGAFVVHHKPGDDRRTIGRIGGVRLPFRKTTNDAMVTADECRIALHLFELVAVASPRRSSSPARPAPQLEHALGDLLRRRPRPTRAAPRGQPPRARARSWLASVERTRARAGGRVEAPSPPRAPTGGRPANASGNVGVDAGAPPRRAAAGARGERRAWRSAASSDARDEAALRRQTTSRRTIGVGRAFVYAGRRVSPQPSGSSSSSSSSSFSLNAHSPIPAHARA